MNTNPLYIIKLNEDGYFGKKPYSPVSKEEAIVFFTMKSARNQLNRLNGRLIKGGGAFIEKK